MTDKEQWEKGLAKERQDLVYELHDKTQEIKAWRAEWPKLAKLHDTGWKHSKALGKLESEAASLQGKIQEKEQSQKAAKAQSKKLDQERVALRQKLQPWAKKENARQVQAFLHWRERNEPEQLKEEKQQALEAQRRQARWQANSKGQGMGR